ncbi:MAG TPA: AAA family ATPase [Alphaproteobacteria bacterium]|nr:AAA family ATPase [Alphaproteobacteria bacterium]
MMLQKINIIERLGKFQNCTANDPSCHFEQSTVIFAPNGHGKTTLTDIIRSLSEKNPDYILGRKRLGETVSPKVSVSISGQTYNFENQTWGTVLPSDRIHIFDPVYISENLFTQTITDEHQTKLSRIVLGHQGAALANQLEEKKQQKTAKDTELKQKKQAYTRSQHTLKGQAVDIDRYSQIAEGHTSEDVENQIQTTTAEIQNFQNLQEIQSLPLATKIAFAAPDLNALKNAYSENIDASHEEAKKRVDEHIQHHHAKQENSAHFIKQGLEQIKDDACPLCSQSLTGSDVAALLDAYRSCFDGLYDDFITTLKQSGDLFRNWNLEARTNELETEYLASKDRIEQWEKHIGKIAYPDISQLIAAAKTELETEYKQIAAELLQKEQNPRSDLNEALFDGFIEKITAITDAVTTYNQAIDDMAPKIAALRAGLDTANLDTLQLKLEELNLIKKRLTTEEETFCTEYKALKTEAEQLAQDVETLTTQLDQHAKSILGDDSNPLFKSDINQVLEDLGAEFRIKKLEIKMDGRKKTASQTIFALEILGQSVSLSAANQNQPNFKNTLSEGDKGTLAFALFLTSLKNDPSLSNALVVFDDPLSSMDEHRRYNTCKKLAKLSQQCAQVITLSHNRHFVLQMEEVYKKKKLTSPRFIKIQRKATKDSEIVALDIEEERKEQHHKNIDDLNTYLTSDHKSTADIQDMIRETLEVHLKFKFYLHLKGRGLIGLGTIADTLQGLNKITVEHCAKIKELAGLSNDAHHGNLPAPVSATLSRDEILPEVRDTLALLEKI